MSFFLLKIPKDFKFSGNEYKEKADVDCLEVRTKDGKSNTRLCKRTDGSWFIQNGNIKIPLRAVEMPELKIAQENGNRGKIFASVNKKFFMKK